MRYSRQNEMAYHAEFMRSHNRVWSQEQQNLLANTPLKYVRKFLTEQRYKILQEERVDED